MNVRTLWVLEHYGDMYEPGTLVGVFSSKELAEQARDSAGIRKLYGSGEYPITDWILDRIYD